MEWAHWVNRKYNLSSLSSPLRMVMGVCGVCAHRDLISNDDDL